MPELPEVETVVQTLRPLCIGKTIVGLEVMHKKMIKPSLKVMEKKLIHNTISDIQRIGKFILFFFADDTVVVSHLRMEGKYIEQLNWDKPQSRFPRLVFRFQGGTSMIYDDMRKFGTFEVTTKREYLSLPSLRHLGQEPLVNLDPQPIYDQFHRANRPIKSLILDQTILLGIGNIYADEILFAAKLHPLRLGKTLTLPETKTILLHAKRILHEAIQAGGTRIRSYQSGHAIDGEFTLRIQVYGKDGQPCPRCQHRLAKMTVGGRGTHYCPACQHHPDYPYVIGVTGEIATGKSTFIGVAKQAGMTVISADDIVHDLYATRIVKRKLATIFPEAIKNQSIDRPSLLAAMVADNRRYHQWLKQLFPMVEAVIIQQLKKIKAPIVLLEVPLLFQANLDALCDVIIGIEAPQNIQKQRLIERNPASADALWILNERNRYRDFTNFVTYRLSNHQGLKAWEKLSKATLNHIITSLKR
ncbi:MAG: DNA-formamidopyrimidine glycosylase [Bacilli bacterium]